MVNRSERIVGFFQPSSLFDSACPLSLVDCVKTDLMREGSIEDVFSNTSYTPSQAIDLGLVDSSLDRFVDPRNNNVLSYEKAVKNKLFNPQSGLMASKSDGNFDMDLEDALQNGLVFKSLLASDAILKYSLPTCQKEVVVVVPRIGTAENPRLREVLDQESKSLIRTSDGAFLSFKELALDMPVVFKLLNQGDIQLLDRNFARVHKPVANFKTSRSEKYTVEYLTLPQALEEGVLQIEEDAVYYVFMNSNIVSLDDAAKRNFISAELFHLMTQSYIELSPGRCISVPEGVRQGLIDWHYGMINTEEGPLTFEEMYERDMMDDVTASHLVIMSCSFAVVTSIITSIQHQSTPLQSSLTQETLFNTEYNEKEAKDNSNKISLTSERLKEPPLDDSHEQFPSSANNEQFQEDIFNKIPSQIDASLLDDSFFSKVDDLKSVPKEENDRSCLGETAIGERIHSASKPEDGASHPTFRPEDDAPHLTFKPKDGLPTSESRFEDGAPHSASKPGDGVPDPKFKSEDGTPHKTSKPEDGLPHSESRFEDGAPHSASKPEDGVSYPESKSEDDAPHLTFKPKDGLPTSESRFEDGAPHSASKPGDGVPDPKFKSEDGTPHKTSKPEDGLPHSESRFEDGAPHSASKPEDGVSYPESKSEDDAPHLTFKPKDGLPTSESRFEDGAPHSASKPGDGVPDPKFKSEDGTPHKTSKPEDGLPHSESRFEDGAPHSASKPEDGVSYPESKSVDDAPYQASKSEDVSPHSESRFEDGVPDPKFKSEDGTPHETSKPEDGSPHSESRFEDGAPHSASKPEDGVSYPESKSEDGAPYQASKSEDVSPHSESRFEDGAPHSASKPEDGVPDQKSKSEDGALYQASKPEDGLPHSESRFEDGAPHSAFKPEDGVPDPKFKSEDGTPHETFKPEDGLPHSESRFEDGAPHSASKPEDGVSYPASKPEDGTPYPAFKPEDGLPHSESRFKNGAPHLASKPEDGALHVTARSEDKALPDDHDLSFGQPVESFGDGNIGLVGNNSVSGSSLKNISQKFNTPNDELEIPESFESNDPSKGINEKVKLKDSKNKDEYQTGDIEVEDDQSLNAFKPQTNEKFLKDETITTRDDISQRYHETSTGSSDQVAETSKLDDIVSSKDRFDVFQATDYENGKNEHKDSFDRDNGFKEKYEDFAVVERGPSGKTGRSSIDEFKETSQADLEVIKTYDKSSTPIDNNDNASVVSADQYQDAEAFDRKTVDEEGSKSVSGPSIKEHPKTPIAHKKDDTTSDKDKERKKLQRKDDWKKDSEAIDAGIVIRTDSKSPEDLEEASQITPSSAVKPSIPSDDDDVDLVISADQFQDAQGTLSDDQSNRIPPLDINKALYENARSFDTPQSIGTTSESEAVSKEFKDYDSDVYSSARDLKNKQKDISHPDIHESDSKVKDDTSFTNRTLFDDINVNKNDSFAPKDGLENKSESIILSIDENSVQIDVPSASRQPDQPDAQRGRLVPAFKTNQDTNRNVTNENETKNEKVSLMISKNKVEFNIDLKGKRVDDGEESDSSQFQDAVQPDNEINYFSDQFKNSFKPPVTTVKSVDSSLPTTQSHGANEALNKEIPITSNELPDVSPTTDLNKSFDDTFRDNFTDQYNTSHKTSEETTTPILQTQEDEDRVELVGDEIKSKTEVKSKDTYYKEDEKKWVGSVEGPCGSGDSIAPSGDLSPHFDEPSEGSDRFKQEVVEGSSEELSGGRDDDAGKFGEKKEIFEKKEDDGFKDGALSTDVEDWKDPSDFKEFDESSMAKVKSRDNNEVEAKIDKSQKNEKFSSGSGFENGKNKKISDDFDNSIHSDETIIDKSDKSDNADKMDDEINELQRDSEAEVSKNQFEDSSSKPEETSSFTEKKEKIPDDKNLLRETDVTNDTFIEPTNDEEKLNKIVKTSEQKVDDILLESEIHDGVKEGSIKVTEDDAKSNEKIKHGLKRGDVGEGVASETPRIFEDKGETSESDVEQYKDAVLYNEHFENKIKSLEDGLKDDKTAGRLQSDQKIDSDLLSKRGSFQEDFHSATDNFSERTDSRRPSSSEKPSDVESSDIDWNETQENFEVVKKNFESMEDEEKTEENEPLGDDFINTSIEKKTLPHDESVSNKNLPDIKQNLNIQDNDDKSLEAFDSQPNELPKDILDTDIQKTDLSLEEDVSVSQVKGVSDLKSDTPGPHEFSSIDVIQANKASTINEDLSKDDTYEGLSKIDQTSTTETLKSNKSDNETSKAKQTVNIPSLISDDIDLCTKPAETPSKTILDESQNISKNDIISTSSDVFPSEDKPISSQITISKDLIPSQKLSQNENKKKADSSVVQKEKADKSLLLEQSEFADDELDGLSKAKAVGLGLMAVVGAPIVAGLAIVDAFKSIPLKHPEVFKEHHPENLRMHPRYAELADGELTPTNENTITPSDSQERLTIENNRNITDTESGLVRDDAKQRDIESYSKENIPSQDSIEDSDNETTGRSEWKPNSPLAIILQNDNFYDAKNNKFINPTNGSLIDLKECMDMGLLDVEDKNIADLESGEVIGLKEAVERGLINARKSFYHADDLNDLSLLEAFNNGLIMDDSVSEFGSVELPPVADKTFHSDDSRPPAKTGANGAFVDVIKHAPRSCSIVEAVISKIYNPLDNTVIDYLSNRNFTLVEALDRGLVTTRTTVFQDPGTGKKVGFEQLLRKGCVSLKSGDIALEGGGFMRIAEAVDKGYLTDEGESRSDGALERPLSLVKILELSLYDSVTGHFIDPDTEERMTLAEALDENLLDPLTAVLNDPGSEKVFSLEEALMRGLVSDRTGAVYDTQARKKISLIEATRRAIVIPLPMTLNMAVDIGLFNEETGTFYDPTCGMCFALQEAIDNGLIDSRSLIVDPATGKVMAIAVATACGILDARNGNVINIHTGQVFSLKDVVLVSSSSPHMSREHSIENNRLSVIHEEDSLSTTSSSSGLSTDKLHRNLPKDTIAEESDSKEYFIDDKKVRDDVHEKVEVKKGDSVKDKSSDEYLSADSLQEVDDSKKITFKKSPTKTNKQKKEDEQKGEDKQKDRFENKSISFTERRPDSPEMRIKPKDRKKEIFFDKNIKTKFVTDSSNIHSPESSVHSNKSKLVPSLGTPKMSVKERGSGPDVDGGFKKFGVEHGKRLEDRSTDVRKGAGMSDAADKGEDFFDAPLPRFEVATNIINDKDKYDDLEKYFGGDEKKDVEEMTADEMLKTLQRHKNWLLQMEKRLVDQTSDYKGLGNDRELMNFFNVVKVGFFDVLQIFYKIYFERL